MADDANKAITSSTATEVATVLFKTCGEDPMEYDYGMFRLVRTGGDGDKAHHSIMFCHWLTGLWSADMSLGGMYVMSVVDALVAHARKFENWTIEDLGRLARRMPTLESPGFARSVIEQLAPVALKNLVPVNDWIDFNSSRQFIGTPGGVLDLKEMKILTPKQGARHLVSKSTKVWFDPKAEHPAVAGLTSHLPEQVQEFFWRSVGYAMLGRSNRRFCILIGDAKSGKTHVAKSLQSALGGYARDIPEGALVRPFRASDRGTSAALASSGSAFVDGVRLAIEDEVPPAIYDTTRMKKITGGGNLEWRKMREDWRIGLLTATPMLFVNDLESLPKLGLDDDALVDRIAAVPFAPLTAKQRADFPDAKSLHHNMDYLTALFAKIVRFASEAARGIEDGNDAPPPLIPEVAEKIKQTKELEAGDIGMLASRIIEAPDAFLPFGQVWTVWAALYGQRSEDSRIGDLSRRGLRRLLERWQKPLGKAKFTLRRYEGAVQKGWVGFTLLGEDEVDRDESGAVRPAATAIIAGQKCGVCGAAAVDWGWKKDGHGGRNYFCDQHPDPETPF